MCGDGSDERTGGHSELTKQEGVTAAPGVVWGGTSSPESVEGIHNARNCVTKTKSKHL